MTTSLVLGARGLLGQAVSRELRSVPGQSSVLTPTIDWQNPDEAKRQLSHHIHEWLRSEGEERWDLYWCAGTAVPNSSDTIINQEKHFFEHIVTTISNQLKHGQAPTVTIFFASSAGGIYGDTGFQIANELTAPTPHGNYGVSKLELENTLTDSAQNFGFGAVIGRISSLYGVEQNLLKRQGLLSHLASAIVRGTSLNLFTSLTTTRNYLDADTAGKIIVHHVRSNRLQGVIVRNICAPYNTSIAELVTLSRQLSGRRILIHQTGTAHANNSRISTLYQDEVASLTRTTIPEGFSKLVRSSRMRVAS